MHLQANGEHRANRKLRAKERSTLSEAYRKAGVDIDAANEAVRRIRGHAAGPARTDGRGGNGGLGGLCRPAAGKCEAPVPVSGSDGVGSKLKLACGLDRHDTSGIDCVAMCVNG